MITFAGFSWVQILTLVVSIVLPVLVALVTRYNAHPGVKAVALALMAAVVGFLSELLDAVHSGHPYDAGAGALTWLGSFIVAVAVHYGLWKPTGITGSGGAVASALPAGVGAPAAAPLPARDARGRFVVRHRA